MILILFALMHFVSERQANDITKSQASVMYNKSPVQIETF